MRQVLRPYQVSLLRRQAHLAQSHRRILNVMPTGAGKTSCIVANTESGLRNEYKVLILAHREELIEQASQRLGDIPHGIIKSGHPERLHLPVQIGSLQTVLRRAYWGGARMFVHIDEAHRAAGESYQQVLARYGHAFVCGWTATPYRSDGAALQPWFDVILETVTPAELFTQGYLIQPVIYGVKEPDLAGVRRRGGEYDTRELEERVSTLTGDLVTTWLKLGHRAQTLCFGVSRVHSRAIATAFNAAGVGALHVDGETPPEERRRALERHATGGYPILCNVDLFTEGMDHSSFCPPGRIYRPLGCIILARPTMSMGLHFQMLGRGTRPPGPVRILDHAGNSRRHGLLRDHHGFTLDGMVQGVPVKGREPVALRRCPVCQMLLGPAEVRCPCGAALGKPRQVQQQAGELELLGEQGGKRPPTPAEKAAAYQGMLRAAAAKGYKPGWAANIYRARFGEWPAAAWMGGAR